MLVAALILFGIAVVLIALRIARAAREAIEREQAKARAGTKERENQYSWLGHIHGYWWALGSAVAGLKYIYRQWKTAPVGGWEKLGWEALLALIVALAMYLVLRLVDQKLNGRRDAAAQQSLFEEQHQE
jgi:lysylphosphatidylglycerol synthetase-like protein (DUF2156 family)